MTKKHFKIDVKRNVGLRYVCVAIILYLRAITIICIHSFAC